MKQSTILIVDDNPQNLEVLLAYLQQTDYKVLAAESGSSALKQIVHIQPDIILLDVMMPEMDGFTVCRRLKTDPQTQDIPIIFTTVLGNTNNKVRGFEVGGVDYITKPINKVELLARLETHLALKQLRSTLQTQATQLEQDVQSRTAELQAEIAHREAQQRERNRLYELVKQQSKSLRAITQSFIDSQQQKQQDLASHLDQHVIQNLDILAANLSLIAQLTQDQPTPEAALAIIATHANSSLDLLNQLQSQAQSVANELAEKLTPPKNPLLLLSDREQEVLKLVIEGKTSFEIATLLSISHNTVRTYRSRMKQKLNISDTASLIKLALQHNISGEND